MHIWCESCSDMVIHGCRCWKCQHVHELSTLFLTIWGDGWCYCKSLSHQSWRHSVTCNLLAHTETDHVLLKAFFWTRFVTSILIGRLDNITITLTLDCVNSTQKHVLDTCSPESVWPIGFNIFYFISLHTSYASSSTNRLCWKPRNYWDPLKLAWPIDQWTILLSSYFVWT